MDEEALIAWQDVLDMVAAGRPGDLACPFCSHRPLTIEEVALTKPGPREVWLRTAVAGLCHSELHFIDKCGHAPMMEVPNEFNEILHKFLTKLNQPAAVAQ